jgi:membrane-associated PAP2 superfamily phosphatase
MNRTGLAIALAIAVAVGLIFAVWPRLDLDLSALFYDSHRKIFIINAQLWVTSLRRAGRAIVVLVVAPAFLAAIGKMIWPRRPMLIEGRAAWFLVVTLALGPGVVTNLVLKDHWHRPRPIDVTEFGGSFRFTPWWDPRGPCADNCSFVSGEPSGAFWTLSAAALAPPQYRPLAYGAALAFGAGIGFLRVGGGAHFFTDVVFAGVFMFLVVWTLHGMIYRWRTRAEEGVIERGLAQIGEALRGALAGLAGWIAGRVGRGP